jgi:hypothetical protein
VNFGLRARGAGMEQAGTTCEWPMTDSGDMLEPPSVAGTQCLVFQPAVLALNWIYLALGVPCTFWLYIGILSVSHESGLKINRNRERVRHWMQLVCVATGSAMSVYVEASRTGWLYGERFGFSRVLIVGTAIYEAAFWSSVQLFLERYVDFARMQAMGAAGNSEEMRSMALNPLTSLAALFSEEMRSKALNSLTSLAFLFRIVPYAMMLARVPMSTTRRVDLATLGLLAFAFGVLCGRPTIRPTLEALRFLLDSSFSTKEIGDRVKKAVRRLERLLTASMLVGALVPTVCICMLFVPGAQALAPYLFMTRILFPLFIVSFEFVLPKQRQDGRSGRSKVSPKSSLDSSSRSAPIALPSARLD